MQFDKLKNSPEFREIDLKGKERLNALFDECNYFSSLCSYEGKNISYLQLWKDKLAAIYREISPDFENKDKMGISMLWRAYNGAKPLIIEKNTEDGRVAMINSAVFNRKLSILHKIEILLRTKSSKRG